MGRITTAGARPGAARGRRLAPALFALAALAVRAPAQEAGGLEPERARLEGELVSDLDDLATWANARKLFLERDRVFEDLLRYDPENERARKFLKYRRSSDGEWIQVGYREPRNHEERALPEYAERRAAVAARYGSGAVGLVERYGHALDRAARDGLLDSVLRLDPDEASVHAFRDEVREGDGWVLRETVEARAHREALRAAVAEALAEAAAARSVPLSPAEEALGVPWTGAMATDALRVLGSGELTEVARAAQVNGAAATVFRRLFGTDTPLYADYTIYLLAQPEERDAFLLRHPRVAPEQREALARLVGTGIPGTADVVYWHGDAAHRLDGTVRHTLGGLLRSEYGITIEHGWAWEGFGIYLTWRLLGTRYTWYVQPSDFQLDDGGSLRALLHVEGTNWTDQAYQVLRAPTPPDLRLLMTRSCNDMELDDMLYAYALAVYLLEARPLDAGKVLELAGDGKAPEEVVQGGLGMSLEQLAERVERWLGERR